MMRLSEEQYEVIRPLLPERFGSWHTIYTGLRRWAEAAVPDRLFQAFQEHRLIMFTAFIHFALIIDMICVNTP